jgi:hypothetical protein
MDVGVRSSNDIYDSIGQVGWKHWVSRKIVDERWSPYRQPTWFNAIDTFKAIFR